MPPPVKKPTAPSAIPPPTNPPVPAESVADSAIGSGKTHIERLQRALGEIDSHPSTPTQARSIVCGYYRFLNPKMTQEHLPRSLKPHPRFPERSATGTHKWDVAFFHIGSAAQGLHEAYRLDAVYAKTPDKDVDAKLTALKNAEDAIARMESRIKTLERLAAVGPADWVVKGVDASGYYLVTMAEHNAMMQSEKVVQSQVEKAQGELPVSEEVDTENE